MLACETPPRPLQADDVALCSASLGDIGLAQALAMLTRAERARARRITSPDYFNQHVKARALLRLLLSRLTGRPPASFVIAGGDGAPRLAINPWGLHLSVSHSATQAMVAAGRAPLGIDIERKQHGIDWQPIADVCFHHRELAHLGRLQNAARADAFFDIWTRKEAYLKATGTGLSSDPAAVSVLGPQGVVTPDSPAAVRRPWYTQTIAAPIGYAAALACRSRRPRFIRFDLAQLLRGHAVQGVRAAA